MSRTPDVTPNICNDHDVVDMGFAERATAPRGTLRALESDKMDIYYTTSTVPSNPDEYSRHITVHGDIHRGVHAVFDDEAMEKNRNMLNWYLECTRVQSTNIPLPTQSHQRLGVESKRPTGAHLPCRSIANILYDIRHYHKYPIFIKNTIDMFGNRSPILRLYSELFKHYFVYENAPMHGRFRVSQKVLKNEMMEWILKRYDVPCWGVDGRLWDMYRTSRAPGPQKRPCMLCSGQQFIVTVFDDDLRAELLKYYVPYRASECTTN